MSSYAPPDKTASDLWNERSILDGLFLGSIAFGVHLTLYFQCVYLISPRSSRRGGLAGSWWLLAYVTIIFVLGNIGNATNIKFGEMVFIDDRNYPGGPGAFFIEQSTNPVAVVCNSVYIVNTWFQDGLLLYRFWVIWGRNYYFLILPAIMYAATVVLSSILIAELSQPGNTIWTKISVSLAIPYWSISIGMTVVLTALISGRLLLMRHRLRKVMGLETVTPYVSLTAMLVESAFLYSLNGVVFLISYAVNSPIQNLALPLLGQTQSIAPLLIILRVAQGRAWSKETAATLETRSVSVHLRRENKIPQNGSTTMILTSLPNNKMNSLNSNASIVEPDDDGDEVLGHKARVGAGVA